MNFLALAKKRCSVRSYSSKKVEQTKLDLILEAARVAPTAANRQPQRLLVLASEASLEKLKKGANVYGAPLALVVCTDHQECWKRSYDAMDAAVIDATIAATHAMLEAAELGLDSIWVCHFNPAIVRSEFSLPDGVEPVHVLGIGYAAGDVKSPDRHATARKPLEELVRYDGF